MEETFAYDDMNRLTGITLRRPSGQSDNLGSWVTITDANGLVEQQMSFDAWGNRRDPQTWANYTANDAFEEPMFDRGFTGHEHLYSFGLINMNGRMYDPVMSSFLSADRYVQNPWSAQGFNRYAYCMYNPLRYVDPSGWMPKQRTYGPVSSSYYAKDFYTFAEHAYEPSDFRNAYYMLNDALYGDMGGPGGNGGGSGGGYYSSYGYQITHYANSVYNYYSFSAQRQLIRNWQNNPSYTNKKELVEAGITNLTVGEVYGSYQGENGYRNSYYTWTDSNGKTHKAVILYENVGGNTNGAFTVSNMPLQICFSMIINRIGSLPFSSENNCAAMQRANYRMKYNVVLNTGTSSLYVNANSSNSLVIDGTVVPFAKATLWNNNRIIESKLLSYSGEESINCPNSSFVGSATFSLPASGSTVLSIEGGWNVSFYPCGNYVPTFIGIPINANTTFVIK